MKKYFFVVFEGETSHSNDPETGQKFFGIMKGARLDEWI